MKRFAVLGKPVNHSLSPRIHETFAQQTRIALRYEALEVEAEGLGEALQGWHAEGFAGFNVTLPHKTAVIDYCGNISDRARTAGAVNTLLRTDAGWSGDNTDGEGLLRDLLDNHDVGISGRRVLVLGAGGAARGILAPLLAQQPAELVLSNRSPWKPETIAEEMAAIGPIRPCTHMALKGDCFDLVINAMSVGHQGGFPRMPDGLFAERAVAYDLSYGAAHQPFKAWAETAGASSALDGLGMLVEQAAVSFERWHGLLPQTDAIIARLRGDQRKE